MSSSLPQSTTQAGVSSSYSATGSFGPVFVVLAVIAVLAVLACVAGRLCARFVPSEPKPVAGGQRKHHNGHHYPRAVKDDDIEAAAIEFRINPATQNTAAVKGSKREPQTAADPDGWAKGNGAGTKNAGASGNIPGSSVKGEPMTSA